MPIYEIGSKLLHTGPDRDYNTVQGRELMIDNSLVWEYVRSCAAGTSPYTDCTPVWQLSAIGAFLVLAVTTFLILVRVRLREDSRLATH